MYEQILSFNGKMCRVTAGRNALAFAGAQARHAAPEGIRIALCADENAYRHHGRRISDALEKSGMNVHPFVIPAGESHKTMDTVMQMYGHFHRCGITRTDLIAALGGGVTGDITGFAASSYLRGIHLMQLPSTLLAQVDSCLGGKTGIDLPFGKNLAGSFYQPDAILADPELLQTLPQNHLAEGMAEVIKYGCILDPGLFEQTEQGSLNVDEFVERCLSIKAGVVEKDEKDTGERMLLNFGHTLGHAAEKCMNFTGISHGAAVAAGMVLSAWIGEVMGDTKPGTRERIETAVRKYGLPARFDLPLGALLDAAQADKKILGGKLNLILLREIGRGFIKPIRMDELRQTLEKVYE